MVGKQKTKKKKKNFEKTNSHVGCGSGGCYVIQVCRPYTCAVNTEHGSGGSVVPLVGDAVAGC